MTQQKPTDPLTVGQLGIPCPESHPVADIPLLNRRDRWRFIDWELVARATEQKRAVSFPCEPDEVDRALLEYHRFLFDRDHCHPFETVYDPENRRLWLWSACFDLADLIDLERAGEEIKTQSRVGAEVRSCER